MIIFADSSAVVKSYLQESGSEIVKGLRSTAVSSITRIECISAFWKRCREHDFTFEDVSVATRAFENDWDENKGRFHIFPVTENTISLACNLVEKYPLRAYDAIQLAQAIILRSTADERVEFLSFDKKLNKIAGSEGFDNILS